MVVGVVAITRAGRTATTCIPISVHVQSMHRAGSIAVCLEVENQMGHVVVLRHPPRAVLVMTC